MTPGLDTRRRAVVVAVLGGAVLLLALMTSPAIIAVTAAVPRFNTSSVSVVVAIRAVAQFFFAIPSCPASIALALAMRDNSTCLTVVATTGLPAAHDRGSGCCGDTLIREVRAATVELLALVVALTRCTFDVASTTALRLAEALH